MNFESRTKNLQQCKSIHHLDPKSYLDMVQEKAKGKMRRYKELVLDPNLFRHPLLSLVEEDAEDLKNEFRQRYIRIQRIYQKIVSNANELELDDIGEMDDGWLYEFPIAEPEEKKMGSLF